MEIKEITEILQNLDTNNSKKTKIRILRYLFKKKLNANEIAIKLNMKSYSHVRKHLKYLYDLYLVDKEVDTFAGEYMVYETSKWFLTGVGQDLVNSLKNVNLDPNLTPKMFAEKIKRYIKNCEKYKNWRLEVIKPKKCNRCAIRGDMQSHHIIEVKDIIEKENIKSIEDVEKSNLLFNINNGECLCTKCHIELHNPI
jgi:DNA-binding transcriptional ArsR family regulator